jgi:predicted oxidoreductase
MSQELMGQLERLEATYMAALDKKDAEISGLQDELKIAAGKIEVQAYDRMLQELAEKDAKIEILEEALEGAREYFADRADVVDGPEGYEREQRPNEAMRLMMTCDDALGRIS